MRFPRMVGVLIAGALAGTHAVPARAQTSDAKILFLGTDEVSTLEDVFVTNPDGTEVTNLSSTPDQDEYEPTWSPDGKHVALMTRPPEGDDWKVSVLDATTGEMSDPLAPGLGVFQGSPTWSPSGKRLAFVVVPARGPALIVVARPDGSGLTILPRMRVSPYYLDWGPNGRIVFNSTVGQAPADLYSVRPDGSGLKRLTHTSEEFEWAPAWSPNGRRIAFAGSNGVYVSRADGTRVREVVAPGGYPDMPSWSPDGQKLTYSKYVWEYGVILDCDVMTVDLKTKVITPVAATPLKCEWDSDWQPLP